MKKYFLFFFFVLGLLFISNKSASAKVIQVCYNQYVGETNSNNIDIQAAFFKYKTRWRKFKSPNKFCKSYFKKEAKYASLKNILKKGIKTYPISKYFEYYIDPVDYANYTDSYKIEAFDEDKIFLSGIVGKYQLNEYCNQIFEKYEILTKTYKYNNK